MKPKKLVSVGIPTYNRCDLLVNAVNSVLNQSYELFEIIISNNNSSDNTKAILNKYDDKRIKIYNQDKNIGVVNNWNFCLKKSKGDYFIMLSDDDEFEVDCINNLVKGFVNDKISISLGYAQVINSEKLKKNELNTNNHIDVINGNLFVKKCLKYNLVAYPSALMFNADLAKEKGNYPNVGTSTDFALAINLASSSFVSIINSYVCKYRVHEKSISRTIKSIDNYELFLEWSKKNKNLNSTIKNKIREYVIDQIFKFTLRNIFRGNTKSAKISYQKLNSISNNYILKFILALANTKFSKIIYSIRKKIKSND